MTEFSSEPIIRSLVIGDLHFKTTNAKESKIVINAILDSIVKAEPDIVVFLGDTLDTFEKIHLSLLKKAHQLFFKCAEIVYDNGDQPLIYVLIGNHDRCNNQVFLTDEHPFIGLKKTKYDNLFIVDKVKDITLQKKRITFCSYVPEDRFFEAVSTLKRSLKEKKIDILFGHEDFSKIKDEKMKDIRLIISGHMHEYNKVGNVFYPGTPYQHNFGEGEKKGLHLIDFFEDGSYKNRIIDVKIEKKKTKEVTEEELEDLDLSKLKNTRIILKGSLQAPKEVVDACKQNSNKLVIEQDVIYDSKGKEFQEILKEMLKDDPDVLKIVNDLDV